MADPSDIFINRYLPNATEEQRAQARANLNAFVSVLILINERIRREEASTLESDS